MRTALIEPRTQKIRAAQRIEESAAYPQHYPTDAHDILHGVLLADIRCRPSTYNLLAPWFPCDTLEKMNCARTQVCTLSYFEISHAVMRLLTKESLGKITNAV